LIPFTCFLYLSVFSAVVLAEAVKSAVDTLKKGYLKQLTFSIRNEGSVLEVYKFQFGSQGKCGPAGPLGILSIANI